MNYESLVYGLAVVILAVSLFYMSSSLKKLTEVIREKSAIGVMPAIAGVVMIASLAAYAYAVLYGVPMLEAAISGLSDSAIFADEARLEAQKAAIESSRNLVLLMKALSFTCFFVSAALLTAANVIYMRKISK